MVPPDDIKTGFRGNRPRLRGEATLKPRLTAARQTEKKKKRVLFVCLGNSCRSQMAEVFAKAYGADILVAESAGLTPAVIISPRTKQVLKEKNLSTEGHFPKGLEVANNEPFDLVINMSGHPVDLPKSKIVEWVIPDPIGQSEEVYRSVRQQIESLVMELILKLRAGRMP